MHGNSNSNPDEHHLYGIFEVETNELYKYGISNQPLNDDGSSPRANQQLSVFNQLFGYIKFYAKVLINKISGRIEVKKLENTYIANHIAKFGKPPRGNQNINHLPEQE